MANDTKAKRGFYSTSNSNKVLRILDTYSEKEENTIC